MKSQEQWDREEKEKKTFLQSFWKEVYRLKDRVHEEWKPKGKKKMQERKN